MSDYDTRRDIDDATVFRAPSGVWWAVHPARRTREFSLNTKDEAEARTRYADILKNFAAAMSDDYQGQEKIN